LGSQNLVLDYALFLSNVRLGHQHPWLRGHPIYLLEALTLL
jgi:hypothetical protein